MKRIIVSAILLAGSTVAMAEAPGGPNCGWGNMLFDGQSGLPSHIVASITNGTSGNATFGMTSGTNGCNTSGTLTYGGKEMINVGALLDEFSEDVARGDGEVLNAVAVSLGVNAEDRVAFKLAMHNNFDKIFPAEDVTTEHVLASMWSVMQSDAQLAKYVS
ncbi:DUF3015 domain-containing protein [Dasania marina]|uniref:DUF3015 domain-containing protein n=1 Tax=Dasania marina TaxID=471499 RepID=UPI000370425E|nr:DUF3015 domain-containing protein [Dasania marina]